MRLDCVQATATPPSAAPSPLRYTPTQRREQVRSEAGQSIGRGRDDRHHLVGVVSEAHQGPSDIAAAAEEAPNGEAEPPALTDRARAQCWPGRAAAAAAKSAQRWFASRPRQLRRRILHAAGEHEVEADLDRNLHGVSRSMRRARRYTFYKPATRAMPGER